EHLRYRKPEAIAAYTRCLTRAPHATDCLAGRLRLYGLQGDCASMERDAREWTVADPDEAAAFGALAVALHARERPWPAVMSALEAKWARTPDAKDRWFDEFAVASARGDFATAQQIARAELARVPPDARMYDQFFPAFELVLAASEAGDRQTVAEVSRSFLDKAAAWSPETVHEAAMPLVMVSAARSLGVLDREAGRVERQRWLAPVVEAQERAGGTDPYSKSVAWVVGYAINATDEESAREALDAMPRYAPIPPPGLRGTDVDLVISSIYLLLGRPEDARPYSETVARSCLRLENPYAWVFGQQQHGKVLAALGEEEAARALYQRVIDAWQGAKPASHRVDAVRAALEALR
ncbi:MAG: hypothetical protein JNK82_35355, partial [Myxococcaceae bacterium]|nr:hypothetical protein [Myxococcaceae bacterium]